jgi:hypothetical protein
MAAVDDAPYHQSARPVDAVNLNVVIIVDDVAGGGYAQRSKDEQPKGYGKQRAGRLE